MISKTRVSLKTALLFFRENNKALSEEIIKMKGVKNMSITGIGVVLILFGLFVILAGKRD